MTTFWCERAIVGNPAAGRVGTGVLIDESDGMIRAIAMGAAPPAGSQRLSGIVLPGLANSHSHTFQRALRGAVERGEGDFWGWRDAMYALARALEPESLRDLCAAAFAEMLLAGVTTVGEFHYVHHRPDGSQYADQDVMTSAVIEAAQIAGIRLSVIDTCYLTGGIGQPLAGAQARFGDGNVERWSERIERFTPSAQVRLCAGVHSVRALVPPDIEFAAAFAKKQSLPLHFHLSEQPRENEQCLAAYGRTPTELLEDCGALGSSSVAVHATFVSEADVHLLGSSATTVCLCPSTEQNLGDGISPAAALARQGSALAVGSDANALTDLYAEARGIELDERLALG
ncbi:MAG: formimidoylglutamate deiminase, partial [Acidimicrobiales bacterium]